MNLIFTTKKERSMKTQTLPDIYNHTLQRIRGLPVFVVEDNPAYSLMLTYSLKEEFNFDISNFDSGEECLLNIEQEHPFIIILDYKLKYMDGNSVLHYVKRNFPEIYVIVLTEQKNIHTAIDMMKRGAFDYLQKSKTSLSELKISIHKVFDDIDLNKQKKMN